MAQKNLIKVQVAWQLNKEVKRDWQKEKKHKMRTAVSNTHHLVELI